MHKNRIFATGNKSINLIVNLKKQSKVMKKIFRFATTSAVVGTFAVFSASVVLMACTGNAASNGEAASADSTATADKPNVTEQVYLVGTMADNECQIELALQMDDNFHCAGYVLYPECEPYVVAGTWDCYYGDDGSGEYHNLSLMEYQNDGTISARFRINLLREDDGEPFTLDEAERTYISSQADEDGEGVYFADSEPAAIIDVTCSQQMPEWMPESLFIPDTYDGIGTHYGYYLDGPDAYGEMLIEKTADGQFTFNAEESRNDSPVDNYASISTAEGRPAEMKGNTFRYTAFNECGYDLEGTFYKRLLFLSTQQKPSDIEHCSYINAAMLRIK